MGRRAWASCRPGRRGADAWHARLQPGIMRARFKRQVYRRQDAHAVVRARRALVDAERAQHEYFASGGLPFDVGAHSTMLEALLPCVSASTCHG